MPRVVVIDDNADDRTIMSALLYYNGFDVKEAASAAEGVELVKAYQTDAVVMDVRMPVVNGLLATEILKAMPETAHVPVICVSADDIPPARAAESGAYAVLRKPLEPGALVNCLHAAMVRNDVVAD